MQLASKNVVTLAPAFVLDIMPTENNELETVGGHHNTTFSTVTHWEKRLKKHLPCFFNGLLQWYICYFTAYDITL